MPRSLYLPTAAFKKPLLSCHTFVLFAALVFILSSHDLCLSLVSILSYVFFFFLICLLFYAYYYLSSHVFCCSSSCRERLLTARTLKIHKVP